MLIFTKDFYQINDLITKTGYVLGRGQINSVLQKQKGLNLIIQAKNSKSED